MLKKLFLTVSAILLLLPTYSFNVAAASTSGEIDTNSDQTENNTVIEETNTVEENEVKANLSEQDISNLNEENDLKNSSASESVPPAEMQTESKEEKLPKTTSIQETATNRLGKLKDSNVKIYKNLTNINSYSTVGQSYADHVYYVHKQSVVNGKTYYQISRSVNSGQNIIGWVNASDITTHSYKTISTEKQTLYLKGTGWAYTEPWGGNVDAIFKGLKKYTGNPFQVDLTMDIGNNIWYRGTIDGKAVYIHKNNIVLKNETSTNRLGKLKNSSVRIYQDLANMKYSTAGSSYADYVYYINRQAVIGATIYYQISRKPDSGIVGWVKSSDLTTHPYKTVSTTKQTLYLKGTGWAYTEPWGGNVDAIFKGLKKYTGSPFQIDLTMDIGNNTWYRGVIDGKTVYIHKNNVVSITESQTSRLGKMKGSQVRIYKDLVAMKYSTAGSSYADHVYYINKQAVVNGTTYYQLNRKPNSEVVGWIKSSDLTTHAYKTISTTKQTLYLKGTGWAYTEPWGGNVDAIFKGLKKYMGNPFQVDLTMDIGNNTWYRGVIDGKTVYIHKNNVVSITESQTSRLGKMKGSQVRIYKDLVAMKYGTAGSSYADHVYYISKQAVVNGTTYYQLSRKPNSGVVGWVKSSDLTTHAYKTISTTKQTLYLKGTGWAYTEPWGGNVDAIFKSLSKYKGQAIEIDLTMDVGNNTWYRGVIAGKTIYIHKNNVTEKGTSVLYSKYNITLSQALNMQMNIKSTPPQTDQKYAYVSKEYVENGKITANALNVRKGPGTNFAKVGTLYSGNQVQIVKDLGEWVAIVFPHNIWVNAIESDVLYYLNPNNFVNDSRQVFQFLDLSKPSGASASQLNAYLKGKGDLDNLGKAFIDAANKYGVNDIYLLSHALLETGNGKYAKFEYNNKTVYNMFGIGAVDSNAYEGAAERAYREGWTTPEKAIIGGAAFIGNNYVKAGQNTLYKMRWNPSAMDTYKYATHQYATDIAWAYKQINTMYRLYQDIGVYYLNLEIPVYK